MRMGFGPLPEPTAANTSGEVAARINHGRWMVDCSSCTNSALVVDFSELIFMCAGCGNADNAGEWLRITIPANWEAIEYELLKRPWNGRNPAEAQNRNWEPGENLATLRQENIDHGIGA